MDKEILKLVSKNLSDTSGFRECKYYVEKYTDYSMEYDEINGVCYLINPDGKKVDYGFADIIVDLNFGWDFIAEKVIAESRNFQESKK